MSHFLDLPVQVTIRLSFYCLLAFQWINQIISFAVFQLDRYKTYTIYGGKLQQYNNAYDFNENEVVTKNLSDMCNTNGFKISTDYSVHIANMPLELYTFILQEKIYCAQFTHLPNYFANKYQNKGFMGFTNFV